MRIFTWAAFAATLVLGLLGQASPNAALQAHTAALQSAKSLSVVFTVAKLPGAPVQYKLSYSKPGMFRIETPGRLIVCDGKTLWDLNKAENTYTEEPAATGRTLEDEVWAWAAFFAAEPFKLAKSPAAGAKRSIKGNAVQEWNMSLPGGKSVVLYLDTKLGVARGASIKRGDVETLSIASELTLGVEPLPAAEFAFAPPAGARKAERPRPTEDVPYSKIDAIFQNTCLGCHGAGGFGGLNLSTYNALMAGGRRGRPVVAGEPDKSILVQYVRGVRSPRMPKDSPPLSESEMKAIENWILGGAKP